MRRIIVPFSLFLGVMGGLLGGALGGGGLFSIILFFTPSIYCIGRIYDEVTKQGKTESDETEPSETRSDETGAVTAEAARD